MNDVTPEMLSPLTVKLKKLTCEKCTNMGVENLCDMVTQFEFLDELIIANNCFSLFKVKEIIEIIRAASELFKCRHKNLNLTINFGSAGTIVAHYDSTARTTSVSLDKVFNTNLVQNTSVEPLLKDILDFITDLKELRKMNLLFK